MKEILQKEQVGPPRGGADRVQRIGADEPIGAGIDDDEREQVDGPDAQRAAGMEVVKVAGLLARGEQVCGNQEAGEDKEENHARPGPLRGAVQRGWLPVACSRSDRGLRPESPGRAGRRVRADKWAASLGVDRAWSGARPPRMRVQTGLKAMGRHGCNRWLLSILTSLRAADTRQGASV
jgi:hypothetical protein